MTHNINGLRAKVTFLLLAFSALFQASFAQNGTHFRYGAQWGGSVMFYSLRHFNYSIPDGPRINDRTFLWSHDPLGFMSVYAGVATGERWASDLHLGYQGIKAGRKVYTACICESFYPSGMSADGLRMFGKAGSGWGETLDSRLDLCLGAGIGYRFVMSRSFALETHLALDAVYDHPQDIIDNMTSTPVSPNFIRRSNVLHTAVQLGVTICYR